MIKLHPLGPASPWECPVCHKDFYDDDRDEEDQIHLAAHCCLWHEIGHPERVRIAEKVERGMSWEDAIKGEMND